ncbi:MAG: hypothetical protein QOJ85_2900 [Solirubrobacteraceae bacterium]|jgi:hypothetical protein|nr:hypothetical protein [Solirubrobacteraceae bacterium]MEA2241974.1 hypothetical protein [Solirubrobacteraceae bacterium]
MPDVAAVLAAVVLLAVASATGIRRRMARPAPGARATIVDPAKSTTMDERGAVRSVQAADIQLPAEALERLWTPMYLERLARTYWRYLTRWTLGVIRVKYDRDERAIVFLTRPFVLLRFRAPEYEMDAQCGRVRWRIESGLLVSRGARNGDGYLQIEVCRCAPVDERTGRVHIEVEVANFYPALASGVARWFYAVTQSRIHVLVTHGFLRSLARLDLAESVVGRYLEPPPDEPGDRAPAKRTAA